MLLDVLCENVHKFIFEVSDNITLEKIKVNILNDFRRLHIDFKKFDLCYGENYSIIFKIDDMKYIVSIESTVLN